MDKTLSGEFGWIEQIRRQFAPLVPSGTEGIGDDCAVIPWNETEYLVVTTDMLVEGIHFKLDRIASEDLGYKSLAVNLSDVASMGATPIASFLSIGLPGTLPESWKTGFLNGYHWLSEKFGVPLLGGDTTGADKVVINVTALGKVARDRIKRRSGARPGDIVCVTGHLGNSAAGLRLLSEGIAAEIEAAGLVGAHNRPRAQLAEGIWLGTRPGVHAMADVSDGIASDLVHILEESGVGAVVDLDCLPLSPALLKAAKRYGWNAEQLAVSGGEDYVLLFTTERDSFNKLKQRFTSQFDCELTAIGEIVAGETAVTWRRGGEFVDADYKGFVHF